MSAQEALDLKYDMHESAGVYETQTRTQRLKGAYLDSQFSCHNVVFFLNQLQC